MSGTYSTSYISCHIALVMIFSNLLMAFLKFNLGWKYSQNLDIIPILWKQCFKPPVTSSGTHDSYKNWDIDACFGAIRNTTAVRNAITTQETQKRNERCEELSFGDRLKALHAIVAMTKVRP